MGHSYVQFRYSNIRRIAKASFSTAEDIAIEAIEPLFQTSNHSTNFIITDEIRKWQPPIETEEEALFFLNKVVSRRIDQHISYLLRESDPFFSKILDSTNYLIRSQGFVKTNYIGKTYIIEKHTKINSEVIGADEFEKFPARLFIDRKKLLSSLIDYLKEETKFFPAIPLNELIFKLKELNISSFLGADEPANQVKELEIGEIVNRALKHTEQKLKETYLETNKLNNEEYENFKKVLADMAVDLRDGGLNPGLYKYLKVHFTNLEKEDYDQRYHNITEYLLRTLKEKIAEELGVK